MGLTTPSPLKAIALRRQSISPPPYIHASAKQQHMYGGGELNSLACKKSYSSPARFVMFPFTAEGKDLA